MPNHAHLTKRVAFGGLEGKVCMVEVGAFDEPVESTALVFPNLEK